MERKPRPLNQPILSRSQWVRIIFIGLLMAIGTVYLEASYEPVGVCYGGDAWALSSSRSS